jgi:hypothetical protein
MAALTQEHINRLQREIERLHGVPSCGCGARRSWNVWSVRVGTLLLIESGDQKTDEESYRPLAVLTCQQCGAIVSFDSAVLLRDQLSVFAESPTPDE